MRTLKIKKVDKDKTLVKKTYIRVFENRLKHLVPALTQFQITEKLKNLKKFNNKFKTQVI